MYDILELVCKLNGKYVASFGYSTIDDEVDIYVKNKDATRCSSCDCVSSKYIIIANININDQEKIDKVIEELQELLKG